jgi:hypothetical protein
MPAPPPRPPLLAAANSSPPISTPLPPMPGFTVVQGFPGASYYSQVYQSTSSSYNPSGAVTSATHIQSFPASIGSPQLMSHVMVASPPPRPVPLPSTGPTINPFAPAESRQAPPPFVSGPSAPFASGNSTPTFAALSPARQAPPPFVPGSSAPFASGNPAPTSAAASPARLVPPLASTAPVSSASGSASSSRPVSITVQDVKRKIQAHPLLILSREIKAELSRQELPPTSHGSSRPSMLATIIYSMFEKAEVNAKGDRLMPADVEYQTRQNIRNTYQALQILFGFNKDFPSTALLADFQKVDLFNIMVQNLIGNNYLDLAVDAVSRLIDFAKSNSSITIPISTLDAFLSILPGLPQLAGKDLVITELSTSLQALVQSLPPGTTNINVQQLTPQQSRDLNTFRTAMTHKLLGIRGGKLPIDSTIMPTDFPGLSAPKGLLAPLRSDIKTPALSDHTILIRCNTIFGDTATLNVTQSCTVSSSLANNGFGVQEEDKRTSIIQQTPYPQRPSGLRLQQIKAKLERMIQENPNLNVIALQEADELMLHDLNSDKFRIQYAPLDSTHSQPIFTVDPVFQISGFRAIPFCKEEGGGKYSVRLVYVRDSALGIIKQGVIDSQNRIYGLDLQNKEGQIGRFMVGHIPFDDNRRLDPEGVATKVATAISAAFKRDPEIPKQFMADTNEELDLLRQHLPELTVEGHPSGSGQSAYFVGQFIPGTRSPNPLLEAIVTAESGKGDPVVTFPKPFFAVTNNVDACIVTPFVKAVPFSKLQGFPNPIGATPIYTIPSSVADTTNPLVWLNDQVLDSATPQERLFQTGQAPNTILWRSAAHYEACLRLLPSNIDISKAEVWFVSIQGLMSKINSLQNEPIEVVQAIIDAGELGQVYAPEQNQQANNITPYLTKFLASRPDLRLDKPETYVTCFHALYIKYQQPGLKQILMQTKDADLNFESGAPDIMLMAVRAFLQSKLN